MNNPLPIIPENSPYVPQRSGDTYVCAICAIAKTIPEDSGLEEAARALEKHGLRPFGPINVCPECQTELEMPRVKYDVDGKLRAVDPISPSELREKKRLDHRPSHRPPFRCPLGYSDTEPRRLPRQVAYKQVMDWTFGAKGLFLIGPTGSGKTRSIWSLLARLYAERYTMMDLDAGKLANLAADKFKDGTGHRWVEQMIMTDILFIDDIGNESKGERGEGTLFTVVKRRIDAGRPVFVTTQKNPAQIIEMAHNRERALAFIRRLHDFCQEIDFSAEQKKLFAK